MNGRIAALARDKHGYPVPWFVATIGGKPDFRVIAPGRIEFALRLKLCWVCGGSFLRQEDRAFIIRPLCAVHPGSPEPPSHPDRAVYFATHCPVPATAPMERRQEH